MEQKLIFLLTLQMTTSDLTHAQKADVARISNFIVNHAGGLIPYNEPDTTSLCQDIREWATTKKKPGKIETLHRTFGFDEKKVEKEK